MAQTFQEWVNSNKSRGVSAQELKDGFFERYGVKLEDQDANADYDAFKADWQTKQTKADVQAGVSAVLPFVSQDALQSTETTPAVVTPTQTVSRAPEPTREPRAPIPDRGDGPTLRAGPGVEGEGAVKATARALLPKAFGIEEYFLGPEPVVYDREKVQEEIAKQATIKPGEYEFDPRQVARLPGLVAGAAAETGKLAVETPVQLTAALTGQRPEVVRAKLGRAVADLSPGESQEAFDPKASKAVVKRYLGEDPEEEARLLSKDIYQNMQEDVEEVLAGMTQSTFTDIIPLLPSKQRKDLEGYFKEGFERGEQLPGFMAAGGAIGAKALEQIAAGEYQKGIRAFAERPATFLLTMAPLINNPFARKLSAPVKAALLKAYTNPTYRPFLTGTLGGKGLARVVDILKGAEPGTTERFAQQKFVDPLLQPTAEATARAERIYEEARATREKARRATEELAADVAKEKGVTEELPVRKTSTTAITEQGAETKFVGLEQGIPEQAELARKKLAKEFGKDYQEKSKERQAYIAEGEALLQKVERGEATQAELQAADLYETSHKERLLADEEAYSNAIERAYREAGAELVEKYGPAKYRQLTGAEELEARAAQFERQGERPAAFDAKEGKFVYQVQEPRPLKVSDVTPSGEKIVYDEAISAKFYDVIDKLKEQKELNTAEGRRRFVEENSSPELRAEKDLFDLALDLAEQPNRIIDSILSGKQITTKPVSPEVVARIRESFKPSYPVQGKGPRFSMLTEPIKRIILEGAANIDEGNYMVFLNDAKIRQGFARYVVDKLNPNAPRKQRRLEATKLSRELDPSATKQRRFQGVEITGESQTYNNAEVRSLLGEYLGEIKGPGAEVLQQGIKDRVLFDVRNSTFKQAIAEGLLSETAGITFDKIKGGVTNILDTAEAVAEDISKKKTENGSLPAAVTFKVTEAQNFEAVVANVAKVSELDAQTLNTYVKASPELSAILGETGGVTYVDPYFNSSFTSILKSFDTIGKVELGFNRLIAEAKRGYTSRNLSSAKNNFIANVLLYSLYYGPYEGARLALSAPKELLRTVVRDIADNPVNPEALNSFARFTAKKPASLQQKVMFDAMRESGLIDNTNISNEVSLLEKGNLFTEFALDPLRRKGVPAVAEVSQTIKKINASQDAAYQFGDNYFKFIATETEVNLGREGLVALEPGRFVDIRIGEKLSIKIEKGANGELYRVAQDGQRVALTETEVTRILTKGAARLSLEKFVDYERIPGYLAWLRSAAPGGIVSLFTTWAYKMMDAPGKRGIVSHFMQNENLLSRTNSPNLTKMSNQIKAQRGMNRTVAAALARTQIDQEQDGDVRRMLAYNPTGLQLITYATSNIDPYTLVYRDTNATNFLSGSETMARALIGIGLKAYDLMKDDLETQTGPLETPVQVKAVESKETYDLSEEVRKLSLRFKAGQVVSAKDVLSIAGFAGSPVFDFFDMVIESDSNPYVDLKNFVLKTGGTLIFGGTGKYLMDTAFTQGVGREYIKEGGDAFTRFLFSNVYKKEQNYSYRSEQLENQKTFAREAVNMVLGTGYRYAFVHKLIGKKDKGAFAKWVDSHKKNLDASLVRARKLRLEALAASGYEDNHPAMQEATRRYELLKEAVDTEHAAFKLRVFDAIDKTGFYENLEKAK